jgi:phage-related protein
MATSAWSIVFYTDGRGGEPIRAFLQSLDLRTQVRFDWSIEQLRLRNIQAREPLVKHLDGPIWELRRESTTNIFRLLYATLPRRRILFLHGFQKKTQQTPPREIALAQRRLTEFLSREGGDPR